MNNHIETLVQRYPQLESRKDDILKAYQILEEAYSAGRKLLVAGNGGSASDSEHIVGELMKEFKLKRKIYAAQIDRLMQIDAEMGTVLADHLQGSFPAISLVGENQNRNGIIHKCCSQRRLSHQRDSRKRTLQMISQYSTHLRINLH